MVRPGSVVAAAVLLALTGCTVPAQPGEEDWRRTARQSVEDMASEVSTARLTLQQVSEDHLVGAYPTVVLVDAEEAAGKAADTITTQQPPRAEQARYATVSSQLGDAADLVTDARIAVVRGASEEYADLVDQLGETADQLAALEEQLTRTPSGGTS